MSTSPTVPASPGPRPHPSLISFAAECFVTDGIRLDANMRATRNAVEQAAGAMARSCPYLAAQHLADLCGLSLEEWAEQVTAEAQVEAEMWAEAEVSL